MPARAPIAVWLGSYPGDLRRAFQAARRDDFDLVAAATTDSQLDPRTLTRSAIRHLRVHLRGLGLSLAQLTVELPGRGLADPARADEAFERLKATLELARQLEAPHAGVTLAGIGDPATADLARELLAGAADLADHQRVRLSVFDPVDAGEDLLRLLDQLDCPWLRVGLDLAAQPAPPAEPLAARIGDVFVRDVAPTAAGPREVPLGRGQVPVRETLACIAAAADDPLWIIRYDDPARPVDALRLAREHVAGWLCGG